MTLLGKEGVLKMFLAVMYNKESSYLLNHVNPSKLNWKERN